MSRRFDKMISCTAVVLLVSDLTLNHPICRVQTGRGARNSAALRTEHADGEADGVYQPGNRGTDDVARETRSCPKALLKVTDVDRAASSAIRLNISTPELCNMTRHFHLERFTSLRTDDLCR